jgi:nucleoside 2-deoxyribosyltransferase
MGRDLVVPLFSSQEIVMRIYAAGPLFSTAECDFNKLLAEQLRLHGHEVFLPQETEFQECGDPTKIFQSDKAGIDWCQLVLANLDGPDPDSGTCWELGYGYGTNKAIICYRTDFRLFEGVDKVNLMMTESANLVIYAPKMSVQELAERIDQEIRNRFEPTRHKPMTDRTPVYSRADK